VPGQKKNIPLNSGHGKKSMPQTKKRPKPLVRKMGNISPLNIDLPVNENFIQPTETSSGG